MAESGRFKRGNEWRVMKERDRKQLQADDESESVSQPPFTPAHLGALQQKWKPVYQEENMLVLVSFMRTDRKKGTETNVVLINLQPETHCV